MHRGRDLVEDFEGVGVAHFAQAEDRVVETHFGLLAEVVQGLLRRHAAFPAVAGLYACPTVVNNVESIASVPAIMKNGKEWFRSMGSEKSPGFTLYSLSGHVASPGQYEAPLGITLRQLLDMSGGMRPGHRLKFWTPGGSSTPMFTDEHLDVPLDYEGVGAAG